eukprot:1987472-Rhodomonas_salina.2
MEAEAGRMEAKAGRLKAEAGRLEAKAGRLEAKAGRVVPWMPRISLSQRERALRLTKRSRFESFRRCR